MTAPNNGGNRGYRPRPRRAASSVVPQKAIMRQRLRIILTCVVVATVALGGRLAWVQLVWGPDLAAKAVTQRERVYIDPARRGDIGPGWPAFGLYNEVSFLDCLSHAPAR